MNKNLNRRPIDWTPQMIKLMKDYYPTMFTDALAKWLGVSQRSLQRKAKSLGLSKIDNFQQVRAEDISRMVSDGLKRAYASGKRVASCKKGERFNPEGEFKKGFKFEGEIEAERVGNIRRTFKRRKLLSIYGLKHEK